MARKFQLPVESAEITVTPDYAECILCGSIGRVRHPASRATAGMIIRCLHNHCHRETRFVYLCDGFSECMAVHRQIVHPIQCRAGAPDAGGCIEPVLSQRFSWGDTEGYREWQKGFYCGAHLREALEQITSGNKQWAKLPESAGYGMAAGLKRGLADLVTTGPFKTAVFGSQGPQERCRRGKDRTMMLPENFPELFSDVAKEGWAQLVMLGFKAGYTHSENQGESMCTCLFCETAYRDPDFAGWWAVTLAEFGFSPIP